MFGDEYGLFWEEEPRVRAKSSTGPRFLPPLPESDWRMPTDFPFLAGHGIIAIDIETHDPELSERGPGAQRDGCYIVGIAVGTQAGFAAYYPIAHAMGENLPKEKVFGWLQDQLLLPVPKLGANILYDLDFLTAVGLKVTGPFYDVQVAEPLLDETRLTYSLESIAQKYLKEGKKEDAMAAWLKRAFGDEEDIKANIWRAPASVVGPYAIGDVELPLRIFAQQKLELERLRLWDLFLLETKLIPMLLAMRQRGVRVNVARAEEIYASLAIKQTRAVEQIKFMTGYDVNLWSAESLAAVFDAVGIPYPRTEKTQAPSFRREWLEQHESPLAGLIRDARNYDKLKETFIQGYVIEGHVNGRIHCQFNQLRSDKSGTVSGRFSSSHPNLQNIPIRTKDGELIRSIFIPESQQDWFKFDWSQIEYRLIVHYAALLSLPGVQEVVDKYWNDADTDYHQVVAEMTHLPRDKAKTLNFGLAYGQGLWLLCRNLGVETSEGEAIIRDYHRRAPFIRPLLNMAMRRVQKIGEIKTLLGRHRRFNLWERSTWDRTAHKKTVQYFPHRVPNSERAFAHKALNALIQGSAADIMKLAMVQIWESGVCDVLGAPHLTVHDELDGSFDKSKQSLSALVELQHIMESCYQLRVPMRVDKSVGPNWGQVEDQQMMLDYVVYHHNTGGGK